MEKIRVVATGLIEIALAFALAGHGAMIGDRHMPSLKRAMARLAALKVVRTRLLSPDRLRARASPDRADHRHLQTRRCRRVRVGDSQGLGARGSEQGCRDGTLIASNTSTTTNLTLTSFSPRHWTALMKMLLYTRQISSISTLIL